MSTALLSADNISCERDDRLLFSDLSFKLFAGDVLQLEGPNGAGKTTLLRILSGLYSGFDGEIRWKEQDMRRCVSEFQQNLLYIGHKSSVKSTLTSLENLRFLMGLQQRNTEAELWQALGRVGLAGYEHVLCRNLSAGQKRRVTLARLFLWRAKVWVLDEVFTAIDKKGVAQLEALLLEKAKNGVAIVLTTHHQLAVSGVKQLQLGQAKYE